MIHFNNKYRKRIISVFQILIIHKKKSHLNNIKRNINLSFLLLLLFIILKEKKKKKNSYNIYKYIFKK